MAPTVSRCRRGSTPSGARHSIGEQLAQIAPWSGLVLIGGFWFGAPLLVGLSLVFVGGLVLFALATLSVEIGASRRALMLFRETRLADDREVRRVRRVVTAGARSYVVGLLDRLSFFLALLFLAEAPAAPRGERCPGARSASRRRKSRAATPSRSSARTLVSPEAASQLSGSGSARSELRLPMKGRISPGAATEDDDPGAQGETPASWRGCREKGLGSGRVAAS
jgi:Putative neutral zinc metallopeptidase